MDNKEIIESLIKEYECVHCCTEEDANKVLDIAHRLGLRWNNRRLYITLNNWSVNESDTCYYLMEGMYGSINKIENGHIVISAKEFIERYESLKKQEIEYSNTLKLHDNEVVHCRTEKEATEVFEIAHDLGYKWCTGQSFVDDTSFSYYREKTCYDILCGELSERSYYEEIGKTIISAEEFIARHNKPLSTNLSISKQVEEIINNDPEKESILQEAERIVNGDRQADYNDPIENFKRIATIASVLIGNEISPKDCCKVMMAVKLAREANKHKRDNLVDLCGYNHILNLIEES